MLRVNCYRITCRHLDDASCTDGNSVGAHAVCTLVTMMQTSQKGIHAGRGQTRAGWGVRGEKGGLGLCSYAHNKPEHRYSRVITP